MKIAVIDYKMGNLHSIVRRIQSIGYEVNVVSSVDEILNADKIILPGVGHFGQAMKHLKEMNLIDTLNETVLIKKKPILGICLGMQLMAKSSSEGGNEQGLGWFDANIKKLNVDTPKIYKVPHIRVIHKLGRNRAQPAFHETPRPSCGGISVAAPAAPPRQECPSPVGQTSLSDRRRPTAASPVVASPRAAGAAPPG